MYNTILVEKKNSISYITVNRPEALNSLNSDVLKELYSAFSDFEKDSESRVAIVSGTGKAFVAGADIAAMSNLDVEGGTKIAQLGHDLMNYIEKIKKPVIAAINGFALGGGCELAMACDIRIASEKAKFGQPEVNLGITPGFGGTQRLGRLVGTGMARYLVMTAEIINCDEAYRIGLVERVTSHESLMEEAEKIAETIINKAPIAIALSKEAILSGYDLPIEDGSALEVKAFGNCFGTQDQKEGMLAFLEKRSATFTNK